MGSGITEINKDTFWQLIEETKNQCGQDMDASISWIKKELLSMPPEQSLQRHAAPLPAPQSFSALPQ